MNKMNWKGALWAAGAVVVVACSRGTGTDVAEGAAPSAGGEPALVIADQGEWDRLVASGQESFDNTCGNCHPGGEADLGPKLKGHAVTSAHMTKQIRNGSGRMAPIGEEKLPASEMKGLLVYLASIQAVGDIKPPPP